MAIIELVAANFRLAALQEQLIQLLWKNGWNFFEGLDGRLCLDSWTTAGDATGLTGSYLSVKIFLTT